MIDYADGHRHFLTAKLKLRPSGKAWDAMWDDLRAEALAAVNRPDDRITIVVAVFPARDSSQDVLQKPPLRFRSWS